MADKKPKESAAEGGDDAPAEGKKKLSGKTLILFIVLPLLLVLGGGGAAVYFLVLKKPDKTAEAHGDAHGEEHGAPKAEDGHGGGDGHTIDPARLLFHPMPEILVNLNSGGRGNIYLKLNVELELRAGADLVALEAVMPRIIDKFQLYLRELRVEDLSGSAGMYRVKEELLRRVNLAAKPVVVNDVLFKELIIQ